MRTQYFVRRDANYYYDILEGGACFGLEGRTAIFACRGFPTPEEATSAALKAGIAESEFEIVSANL